MEEDTSQRLSKIPTDMSIETKISVWQRQSEEDHKVETPQEKVKDQDQVITSNSEDHDQGILQSTTKEGDKPDTILKKRDHGDDQDKDPLAGLNQGKSLARTSKSGKSVTTKESVEEPVFEIALDDDEQTIDDKVGDAGQPPHTDADETQAYGAPRISKKDWFKEAPRPETLDPDWNTVKTIDDTPKQLWFNEMVQAEKPPLMFNELMSTPINFSAFAINRLKLNKITRAYLAGPSVQPTKVSDQDNLNEIRHVIRPLARHLRN
ncbi:hypothetical protein Tco_1256453 [Tanacetum coccineum]